MNTKLSLLVGLIVAICAAAALGTVATRAHAAISNSDKQKLYQYCRASGKDPKFCCETVGGAYTTWVDQATGAIHTECVFADSPGANSSNLGYASPPFERSLIGPSTSMTVSAGLRAAGLYGVVAIDEVFDNVIP